MCVGVGLTFKYDSFLGNPQNLLSETLDTDKPSHTMRNESNKETRRRCIARDFTTFKNMFACTPGLRAEIKKMKREEVEGSLVTVGACRPSSSLYQSSVAPCLVNLRSSCCDDAMAAQNRVGPKYPLFNLIT
jgi:hypothetical protein